jgi:DNA-binding CsgD family transcriptional regulator
MRHDGVDSAGALVGRAEEFRVLRGFMDALLAGRGGTALVIAEPGAGKSALLDGAFGEGVRAAAGRLVGVATVWGTGDELAADFPLLPWLKGLRDSAGGLGAVGPYAEMTALLRGAGSGEGVNVVAAASELFVEWVERASTQIPVLAVFDDLQWADAASLRVWRRLAQVAQQVPVLVVGALRSGSAREDVVALRRQVAAEQTAGRGLVLELEGLSTSAVTELVANLAGGTPAPGLVTLAGVAGGNPLYVTELLGALAREGALTTADAQVEVVGEYRPLALSETIGSRLDAVGRDCRRMLSAAAVLGVEFAVVDLALASGPTPGELTELLAEAEEAGVLTASREGMRFRHPVIRDVLYEQMPAGARVAWHLSIARLFAQEGAPATLVARHLSAALAAGGQLRPVDWTVDWLVENGGLLERQAVPLAVKVLGEVWQQLPSEDDRKVALAVPLARTLIRVMRRADARQVVSQTFATAPAISQPDALELHIAAMASRDEYDDSSSEANIALLDAAEKERDWRPEHLIRLQEMRARNLAWGGRWEEARELGTQVLEIAAQLGDLQSAVGACKALGNASFFQGDLEAAHEHFGHGIALTEADSRALQIQIPLLVNQARALLPVNRFADAETALSRARTLAEKIGDEEGLSACTKYEIYRLFAIGSWDDLLTEADGAPQHWWALMGRRPWGAAVVVALHRDDGRLAGQYWDRIHGENYAGMRPDGDQLFDYVQGLQAEYHGDAAQALQSYIAALDVREQAEHPGMWNFLWMGVELPLPQAVRLAQADGDRKTADALVRQTEQMIGLPRFAPVPKTVLADVLDPVLAHARGLLESDPDLIQRAVDYYRQVGKRLYLAQTLESLAAVLAQRSTGNQARPAMTEALQVFESLGAAWDVKRMRSRFRQLGLRPAAPQPRRRATHGRDSLTTTEMTVAGLVAEGMSNPQIAEQLFLSRRTVETHVSHILTKLDARSRVDIAITINTHHAVHH